MMILNCITIALALTIVAFIMKSGLHPLKDSPQQVVAKIHSSTDIRALRDFAVSEAEYIRPLEGVVSRYYSVSKLVLIIFSLLAGCNIIILFYSKPRKENL
jgi:hypothetical protein